jgi:hypothetical protein
MERRMVGVVAVDGLSLLSLKTTAVAVVVIVVAGHHVQHDSSSSQPVQDVMLPTPVVVMPPSCVLGVNWKHYINDRPWGNGF